jgi:hypothetical protein
MVAAQCPSLSSGEQARLVDEVLGMTAAELRQSAKEKLAILEIGMKKGLAKPGATVGEVLTEKDILKAYLQSRTKGGKKSNQ